MESPSIVLVQPRAKVQLRVLQDRGYLLIDVSQSARDDAHRFEQADLTVVHLPRLCPDYPHGGIPVPGIEGATSETVSGIWHGLKVFENEGPQTALFKRGGGRRVVRKAGGVRGRFLGHHLGNGELLDEVAARERILTPVYDHVLSNAARHDAALVLGLLQEGNDLGLICHSVAEIGGMLRVLTSKHKMKT